MKCQHAIVDFNNETLSIMRAEDGRILISEIKPAPYLPGPKLDVQKRNEAIIEMRKEGHSLKEIGDVFDLHPTRISQIAAYLPPLKKKTRVIKRNKKAPKISKQERKALYERMKAGK